MRFRSQGLVVAVMVGLVAAACGGKGEQPAPDGSAGSAGTSSSPGGTGGAAQAGAGPHPPTAGSSNAGASTSAGSSSGGAAGGNVGGAASGSGGLGGSAGAAGLGGSGGKAGAGGTASDAAATVKMLQPTISAFCAAARGCCVNQSDPPKLDDCESAFPSNNATVASLASGAATLDATALATCLAAYQAAATACTENPVLSACRGVVVGTRPENAPCTSGSECLRAGGQNTCLITEQNGTVGVCRKIPHYKAGDACSFTCYKGEDCTSSTYGLATSPLGLCFGDDGVYCDYLADAPTCKAVLSPGTPCTSDSQCGSTGYCQTTCQKRGVEGDPCTRCLDSLMCVKGKCQSPPFASSSTCEGRSLG